MNKIFLNQVALWRAKASDDFNVRISPAGRTVWENNIAIICDKPIFRYAKNYEKDGFKFCLFLNSTENAPEDVEAFLDTVSENVPIEKIEAVIERNLSNQAFLEKMAAMKTIAGGDFEYLDIHFGGKK